MHGLQLVVVLAAGSVALSQGAEETTSYPDHTQTTVKLAHTRGSSGVTCTRFGRQCVSGMSCTGRQCRCPRGYTGNAQFECTPPNERVCFITDETTVNGFGKGSAPVFLPCTYRATRFLSKGKGPHSSCAIEVHVTNEAWRNLYRARAVHVSVGMTEPMAQVQTTAQMTVIGSFGANNSKVYTYELRATPTEVFAWGSASRQATNTSERVNLIRPEVDEVDNFLTLDVPQCGVRVRFRSYDSRQAFQALLPGVSIVVPRDAVFVNEVGNYPYALCGRTNDRQSLYSSRARARRLGSVANTVLADILQQQPPQLDNPLGEQCQAAMSLFASSSDQKADIKACAFLLARKTTRGCLDSQNLTPITVFNACLKQRQDPRDTQACSLLQEAVAKCRSVWVGPKTFCAA